MSDETKLWPANVPAEADATRMLLGELSPGEFQSVVDSFRASLGPVEKGVLDLRSHQVLVTALAVKWRLTAAIAVAPVKLSEVDLAALDAMVQESQDAALGLTSGASGVTDFNLKQIFESTKRSLNYLGGKLKAAVPKEAPPAPPPAPEPAAPPPEARPAERAPEPPPPSVAAASIAAAAAEVPAGASRGLVMAGAAILLVGLAVHGYNFMQERAEKAARAEKEAKLPTEHKADKVTHITLRSPSPQKVAELQERARAEGKKLLQFSPTEFQLVDEGGAAPAPTPEPPKEEPRPEGDPAPEGAAPEGAKTETAPAAPEGAKP